MATFDVGSSVVAFLNSVNGVVGTGFFAENEYIFTCEHVIASSLGVDRKTNIPEAEKINVRFAGGLIVEASLILANKDIDVAILKLGKPLNIPSLKFGYSSTSYGHSFMSYGFPGEAGNIGINSRGTIVGRTKFNNGEDVLQLKTSEISQGMSGAPIVDVDSQLVIGMVMAVMKQQTGRFSDAAFAIPSETLKKIYPLLKLIRPNARIRQQPLSSNKKSNRPASDMESVSTLQEAMNDKNSNVRRTAAKSLGQSKDSRAIPVLLQALDDENQNVRQAVVESLGNIGDQQVIPSLRQRLDDGADSVRKAATEAIHRIEYNQLQSDVSSQSSNQTSSSGNNQLSPDIPDTINSESSLPTSEPEFSEIIKQYGITEDALDKHVATDKPIQSVKQDRLDFKIYVNALHSFILSKYTTTPITISIDGVWGTGKSSLMSMLKGKLDPQRDGVRKFFEWWSLFLPRVKWYWRYLWSSLPKAYGKTLIALVVRNDVENDGIYLYLGDKIEAFKNHVARVMDGFSIAPESLKQPENESLDKNVRWWAQVNANCEPMEPPYHYTVWLNAWKFDNQEEVWASLALATMEQIKQKHGLLWRLRFWLEITFSRLSFLEGLWQVVKQFLLPLVFAVVAAYYEVILGSFDVQLDAFKNYGSPLLVAGAIISGLLSVWSIFKDPFQIPLDKVFDRPNYKDKVKFLSHFEKDFARIVRAATKNGFGWKRSKLVIFIDDLDRCEPPKSADIVEAVNLFLDAEGCVFVIGMDSESVAMSIEVKYKDLFERMKAENTGVVSLGRLFLDKIVQIPFSVPRPTSQQITSLVNDTLGVKVLSLSLNISIGSGSNNPAAGDSGAPVVDATSGEMTAIQTPEQTENIPLVAQPRVDPASYAKPEVRAAIIKGTELLADNPRQVKTFINLFRLSIYIANERKILEEKIIAEKTSGLNLEKLAIWTACSVRWTGFVRHLYAETQTDSLCNFIHNVSEDLTPEFAWKTGNKNIPAELKKKLDALRKSEKGSEAHWCHLPWEWWLLEPDFLKTIKSMQDLWRPTAAGETAWLKSLLTMTKPIA